MRIAVLLALIAPVVVLGHPEPARAAGNGGGDSADDLVWGMFVTLDGAPVLAFGLLDLDRHRGTAYGATELTYNALVGRITRDIALDDDPEPDPGAPLLTAGAVHTALMVDGVVQIGESRRWRTSSTALVAGLVVSAEWFMDVDGDGDGPHDPPPDRGATYGIAEIACNAPLAVGFTYLTISEARGHSYGRASLAATGASLAGAMLGEGVDHVTAHAHHHHLPSLAPTIVDGGAHGSGEDLGVGLGTRGRW